jgi:hypothetical protein
LLSGSPLDEAARKLLLTAAARLHADELQYMVSLPYFEQRMEPPTVAAMLQQLMTAMAAMMTSKRDVHHAERAAPSPAMIMQLVCRLPAAAELSADTVVQLLLQAVQQRLPQAVRKLAVLVWEQNLLSCEQLVGVLESSLSIVMHDMGIQHSGQRHDHCLRVLCELAEAMELSSAGLLQLLFKAVELEPIYSKSIPSNTAHMCVGVLCEVPAAQQIHSDALAGLMQAAVKHKSDRAMFRLIHLPAAGHLTCEDVHSLFDAAISSGSDSCMEALVWLPAAQHTTSQQLLQLLEGAATSKCGNCQLQCECMVPLCSRDSLWDGLPTAESLNNKQVLHMLEAALASGHFECLGRVRQLPPKPSMEELEHEVEAVAALCDHGCIRALDQLPSARLSSRQVLQLLKEAIKTDSTGACLH